MRGQGDLPPLAGQFSGPLLLCASGRGLHADAARFPLLPVLAVNHAAVLIPRPILHLASLHHELVVHYLAFRARKAEGHIWTHSGEPADGVEIVWRLDPPTPCSGLFGAVVSLALGYAPVILAGCPEDNAGHFYDPPDLPGDYLTGTNADSWIWHRNHVFAGRVKSLSGRTRDWLGAPDGI